MTDKKNGRDVDSEATVQEKVRQAVIDFINFEDETSQIWPWAMTAEELLQNEEALQKIVKAVEHDGTGECDTDELYDTISRIASVNPILR